jgi:HD-GYP domain-containing protein (c-di-GMP phosphodiesterase class II)
MKLALPVRHPQFPKQVLLKMGYSLDDGAIRRMETMGVRSVWVRYPSLDFLRDIVSEQVIDNQSTIVQNIASTFEAMQKQASAKLDFNTYTSSITTLVETLIANPQSAVFLGELSDYAGDDLLRHSNAVTYLSLLMGLKLEGYIVKQRRHVDPMRAKDVINLGVGAMMHDLGVTQLDPEVRKKHRETGDETDKAWQEHAKLGYEMVRGKVEPTAATVVLNHHQRADGTGYAGKDVPILDGTRIHVFARIVGLADQFDRMKNPPGLPPQSTVWVLSALLSPDMQAKFDVEVLRALFMVVPPYPPGTVLQLSDDRWAVAIDHNIGDPCRPVVQIIHNPQTIGVEPAPEDAAPVETIDLSQHAKSLYVAMVDKVDVSDLNFEAPAFLLDDVMAAHW